MTPRAASLASALSGSDYNRQRLDPRPADQFYLHLSDLLHALQMNAPSAKERLLDFGCGGSPYAPLFAANEYVRADHTEMPGVDYRINEDGTLPELGSESFDVLLSTQVLEHVPDPAAYLGEALRLLRPGGILLLSTHGTFSDHPCPGDYWRWTRQGLQVLLDRCGFPQADISHLTCGSRAAWFLMDQTILQQRPVPPRTSLPAAQRLFQRLYMLLRPLANSLLDWLTASQQIVAGRPSGLDLYLGLFAVARKPDTAPA